jgi:hypothetical protein
MTDSSDQNRHRISLYVSHTMYVKMCEANESQAVVVNRALEQYFTPSDEQIIDTQTSPEDNSRLLQLHEARIIDLTARLEEKDVKFSELQDQIITRLEEKDLRITDLQGHNETLKKELETLQSMYNNYMLQVQTIINQRAIEEPKRSFWKSLKFW